MMEAWTCSHCSHTILGSLTVVLVLASAHRCNGHMHSLGQTVCLDCRQSPTGLCVYHTQRCLLKVEARVRCVRSIHLCEYRSRLSREFV